MILETIAEATRKRVAAEKEKCSLAEMKEKATAMNPDTGLLEQALKAACPYLRGKKPPIGYAHHRRRFPLSGDCKGI